MRIIEKVYKKIKHYPRIWWSDTLLIMLLMALAVLILWLLFRLQVQQKNLKNNPVRVVYSQEALMLWQEYQQAQNSFQNFFASKNGSVVYSVDCDAGNRVKEENRIYFETLEQAISEGYRISKSC